jgi:glycosyltransferase involved in cell wall biosynthesis
MSKKVCLIVQNPYPRDVRIRKEAMALISKGHKVSVIALCDPKESRKEVVDGVTVYRIALPKKREGILRYLYEYSAFFLHSIFKLNKLDLQENFDVVQISTLPDFLVFCALIQKLKGRRIVLDMHEIMPEFFMSKFGVGFRHPVVRLLIFLERISLKFADAVITVNDPIKMIFQKRAIPQKAITVVMNSVDESAVKNNGKRPHANFNCVYHGTITDIYGLDTAIKSFAKACRGCRDMAFHIFGNGPELSELKELTKRLGIQQSVVFHGLISHAEVFERLAEMDLGILASRKDAFLNLSFSNKLAEYIWLKIPVACSDLDSTKYYFTDEHLLFFEAGNIDELARKIKFAYANKENVAKMAELAYEEYREHGWGVMAQRYSRVIEG